jgi:hypothetical protein
LGAAGVAGTCPIEAAAAAAEECEGVFFALLAMTGAAATAATANVTTAIGSILFTFFIRNLLKNNMSVVSVRSAFQQSMCLEGGQPTLGFSVACDAQFHSDLIVAPSLEKKRQRSVQI